MTRTSDLSDRDYESLATFRHALRKFLRFSEEAAREHGLTPNQHQLLLAIRGSKGPGRPSISEVAELLQLRTHSTVELARRAADAGLVTFHDDPDDGRKQLLGLTAAGKTKLAELSRQHRDELRRFRHQLRDVLDSLD